jgi:N-methylhydantoinase A
MQPTTTDAHLHLGRLSSERYLAGTIEIRPELAEEALKTLGERMGMDTAEVASGILRIANANMTAATHLISVQRGHDPRDFTLVAAGGAGPLHGVDIARELGIPRVVVPRSPGLTSALGILFVDLRNDFQQPILRQVDQLAEGQLTPIYEELMAKAASWFEAESIPPSQRTVELSVDVRYYGQTSYMNVPVAGAPSSSAAVASIAEAFENRCQQEFGYVLPRSVAGIELVNARVAAIGLGDEAKLPRDVATGSGEDAKVGMRPVYFDEAGAFIETAIYDRNLLRNGVTIAGPAIVEQLDSTVVLPPGTSASVDEHLHIVIAVSDQ